MRLSVPIMLAFRLSYARQNAGVKIHRIEGEREEKYHRLQAFGAAASTGTPHVLLVQPNLLNSGQTCDFFFKWPLQGCDFKHNPIHQNVVVQLSFQGSGNGEVIDGILLPSSVLFRNCMRRVIIVVRLTIRILEIPPEYLQLLLLQDVQTSLSVYILFSFVLILINLLQRSLRPAGLSFILQEEK